MSNLKHFEPIAEAIAKLLYPFAEVVLHDIRANRIAAIFNNFSRRSVGDDSLISDAEGLDQGPGFHGPFPKRGFDGRRMKYVTSVLRNDAGEALGLLCVNMDLAPFQAMEDTILKIMATDKDSSSLDASFEDDWQERISGFVHEYLQDRRLTLSSLTRDERKNLVGALKEAGAFRAPNAAAFAASVLGVSRATVYKDLAGPPDET